MINVTGVLVDPTGNPLLNHDIRITSRVTVDNVVEESTTTETTTGDGTYNFNLGDGWYYLEILLNNTFMSIGDLIVNSGTPTPITLPDLLVYSTPVEVDGTEYTPFWQNLVDLVDDSPLAGHRTNRNQMVDTLVHVADIQTTDVGDGDDERKATSVHTLKTCDAEVTHQALVYSDEEGNKLASEETLVKTDTASNREGVIVTDEIHKSKSVVSLDYTEEMSEAITSTGSVLESLITFDNSSKQVITDIKTDDIIITTTITSSFGNNNHLVSLTLDDYIEAETFTYADGNISEGKTHNSKTLSITTLGKVSSDIHTNDGVTSVRTLTLDDFIVGRIGNDLFEVDTTTDTVYVRGKLRIDQIQDTNGNDLDLKDGDTIFQVFQYADNPGGPWVDILGVTHEWKRENVSTNGVVDGNAWSIAYRLTGEAIVVDGDTIFEEYNYSIDGSTAWHSTLTSGDAFRRERTVVNGVPGPWSTPGRLAGENGDEIEIKYQYSINGINFWHFEYSAGDMFERRARFVNGVLDSAWYDPIALGSEGVAGADGADGADGVNSRGVTLTTDSQVFVYLANGSAPFPSGATVSATAVNTSGTLYYEFFKNDVSQINSTSNTYTYTPQTSHSNMPDKIEVQIREDGPSSPILARDQLTMSGVHPGTDAITTVLTNEAHTLPTTNVGVVTYTNSGTSIYIYQGSSQLQYDGSGTSNGTWKIASVTSNITRGSLTDSGSFVTVGNSSNMTSDIASITYTITGKMADGTDFSVIKVQSLSKSIQGTDGSNGDDGIPGLNGSGWYSIVNAGKAATFPSDAIATSDFIVEFGRVPQEDDHLFYVNALVNATVTSGKRCVTPAGAGTPAWSTPVAYFDGDVIVKGTLSADRMIANTLTGNEINSQTTIIAGSGSTTAGMNGYDGTSLPAWQGGGTNIYKDWRFWSGATNPAFANFRVNDTGILSASSANIHGAITATSLTASSNVSIGPTSGSRVHISTDKIEVYDGVVLRVKIGNLA